MKEPKEGDHVLEMHWDDKLGGYKYYLGIYEKALQLVSIGRGFRDRDKYDRVLNCVRVARGDKDWAKRTAEHYNIPMPLPGVET